MRAKPWGAAGIEALVREAGHRPAGDGPAVRTKGHHMNGNDSGAHTHQITSQPGPGMADIRIIAGSPETAQEIAEVLRHRFAATAQRSYPTAEADGGTRLHLTVDITLAPDPPGPPRPRRVTEHPHSDEL
ncbi:hypothetical protein GCM10010400_01580 [Streptomyces aculeolatus]